MELSFVYDGRKIELAKTNKQEIMKLIKSIHAKEGEGSIYDLGSKNANLKMARWSTNIEDFDHIIGGGMPEGRIIEIFGPESSGKTSLGYHLAGLHDLALYIPIEGTFDVANAKVFGNRKQQLIVYRARYGEQALNKTMKFAQAGIPLIVIDSVPALKPKEDIDKVMKNANKGNDAQQDQERMGGVARLLHKYLPVLEEVVETTGTTIILINQVRDKMNAMMFGEKTDTPGGRAPKFYSSIRIQVARKSWIEIPNKNPRNAAATEKIGLIMKMKVIKSKVCNPMGEAEIPMFFGKGFSSFDDISKIRSEMMKANKGKKGRDDNDDDDEE
jgi:recombination protein RecA